MKWMQKNMIVSRVCIYVYGYSGIRTHMSTYTNVKEHTYVYVHTYTHLYIDIYIYILHIHHLQYNTHTYPLHLQLTTYRPNPFRPSNRKRAKSYTYPHTYV